MVAEVVLQNLFQEKGALHLHSFFLFFFFLLMKM